MATPINPLPTPPSPADSPADFNLKAFALLGALPAFVTEANAQASGLDAAVASAGLEADAAALKAGEALTSANNAALSKTGADSARDAASLSAASALDSKNAAQSARAGAEAAAAAAHGGIKAYATHAEASIAAALLPDGADAEVFQDETRAGARTRYKVQAGALVFVVNLDQIKLDLAAATGASLVGFQQEGTGAVSTTVQRKLRESVSVKDFGAVGDGVADDTAGIQAARDWVASALAAGNIVKLIWPAGRYLYSVSPNWAISRLDMQFDGEVWLINTGTGDSFIADGGATGAGVYGLKITGFPLLHGPAWSLAGYYLRSVHRSFLELDCRGAGTSSAGLYMEWCVSNTIHYIMNYNAGGLYSTPAEGMHLTQRGAGEETSYNTFINPECSGMPIGIYQDGALGNLVIGGAVQGCTNYGLQQTANAWNNKFIGTDFEVNTNADIVCDGRESQFFGVDSYTLTKFTANAVNCSMHGGAIESVVIDASAARTLLTGVTYNRFGAGTITDNGTATRYRDITNKSTNITSNTPRARTPITVGASPYTYTNNTGNEISVLVTGGTVSQLVFTRFAGDVVDNHGMFTLSPGDSVGVTYTVAPVMVAYTR